MQYYLLRHNWYSMTVAYNNNYYYNYNKKHAYAGQLNRFTHPRALLVLHDLGLLAHATSVTGHYSSN
jgi:hypothetical protein